MLKDKSNNRPKPIIAGITPCRLSKVIFRSKLTLVCPVDPDAQRSQLHLGDPVGPQHQHVTFFESFLKAHNGMVHFNKCFYAGKGHGATWHKASWSCEPGQYYPRSTGACDPDVPVMLPQPRSTGDPASFYVPAHGLKH